MSEGLVLSIRIDSAYTLSSGYEFIFGGSDERESVSAMHRRVLLSITRHDTCYYGVPGGVLLPRWYYYPHPYMPCRLLLPHKKHIESPV